MKQQLESIHQIRTFNNDLWMEILEIACKAAPDRVATLLEAIRFNDEQVSNQMTSLARELREDQARGVLHDADQQPLDSAAP